jgi:hypothetical protein
MKVLYLLNVLIIFLLVYFSNGQLKTGYPNNDPLDNLITDYDYYEVEMIKKMTKIPKRVRAVLKELNRPGNRHNFGSTFNE